MSNFLGWQQGGEKTHDSQTQNFGSAVVFFLHQKGNPSFKVHLKVRRLFLQKSPGKRDMPWPRRIHRSKGRPDMPFYGMVKGWKETAILCSVCPGLRGRQKICHSQRWHTESDVPVHITPFNLSLIYEGAISIGNPSRRHLLWPPEVDPTE